MTVGFLGAVDVLLGPVQGAGSEAGPRGKIREGVQGLLIREHVSSHPSLFLVTGKFWALELRAQEETQI